MKINLSIRMKMNASLVEDGARVADIGCDHGYVSMWLAKQKKCPTVIATDINKGPLRIAEKNISGTGLDGVVELRLGDGLSPVKPGEVSTVLIAGMGGMLMCEILSNGTDVLESADVLVLQPQSDIEAVRRHIHRLGFYIDKESICMEDGRYYISIRAKKGEEKIPYSDTEYRFSRLLSEEGGSVYKSYIRQLIDKTASVLDTLDAETIDDGDAGERLLMRKEELVFRLNELKKSL